MQIVLGDAAISLPEINYETLDLIIDQVKKNRLIWTILSPAQFSVNKKSWLDLFKESGNNKYSHKLPRTIIKPCTILEPYQLKVLLQMTPDELFETIIDYYQVLVKPRQISLKSELDANLQEIFRNSPSIRIYDRYLLRATKAIISGTFEDASLRRKQLKEILSSAESVASSRADQSNVEVVIYSEIVCAREWASKNGKNVNNPKTWKEEWEEWFHDNDTQKKTKEFAKWIATDMNEFPHLSLSIRDCSQPDTYASNLHDRFLDVANAETWVSSAGFALENRDGRIKPSTYLVAVERPPDIDKVHSTQIY